MFSIALFIISVRHGAYFMFLTGVMMCLAGLTYGVLIQNDPPFLVRFPDAVLRPKFNYSFYLTTVTGVVTMVCACLIVCMDFIYPRKVASFFHHALTEEDTVFEVIKL